MARRTLERSLADYENVVKRLPAGELTDKSGPYQTVPALAAGPLEVFWAPFDHVNRRAKVVLVGITPGGTQMSNSIEHVGRIAQYTLTPAPQPKPAPAPAPSSQPCSETPDRDFRVARGDRRDRDGDGIACET